MSCTRLCGWQEGGRSLPHVIWNRPSPALPPSPGSLLDEPWGQTLPLIKMWSCPLLFLEFSSWFQNAFCRQDQRHLLQVPVFPWIYVLVATGDCQPKCLSLHLCKSFVEAMNGICNTPGSRILSLSHLLTFFYLLPVLGLMLHTPGFLPFPLYIKLCLNQSNSITFFAEISWVI